MRLSRFLDYKKTFVETRFNTGDTVFIPATITNAIIKDNKVFYGIKESDSIVDENICRTEDQVIHNQTAKISMNVENWELDETMKKNAALIRGF